MINIYKILISIFLISMLVTMAIGTASAFPVIEWEKTHFQPTPTFGAEYSSVQQTIDGGYIVVGEIIGNDDAYCGSDGIITKTDKYGNKQWYKAYRRHYPNECNSNSFSSVQQTTDGGYIIAGDSGTIFPELAWLIKTNSNGNISWEKIQERSVALNYAQQTIDGDYILAGADANNTWIVKTDSNGNKLWKKTFTGTTWKAIVQQTKDGGYILAGAYINNIWLIKTDSNGNILWKKMFIGTAWSAVVQQTTDGGYILTTYGTLIKTDGNGNKLWNKTFGGSSVQQTKDGGYILANYNTLRKTDGNGNKLWNKIFDYSDIYSYSEISSARQTIDGGYILAGRKAYFVETGELIWGDWLAKITDTTNSIKNPGFETVNPSNPSTPLYWSKFQTGTKATFTYPEIGRTNTGKSVSIKYTTKETGKVALWQQSGIPIAPNKQYKLSGYMKLSNVTGGGSSPRYNGADLRINWYKSDGSVIKVDLTTKSGTSPWTRYEKIFTAPSNAVKANLGGDLFNASGKVWFDDLSFIRIS